MGVFRLRSFPRTLERHGWRDGALHGRTCEACPGKAYRLEGFSTKATNQLTKKIVTVTSG